MNAEKRCPSCGKSANCLLRAGAVIDDLHSQLAASGNYVADREVDPLKVTFANGRTVEIVDGHLVIGRTQNEELPVR